MRQVAVPPNFAAPTETILAEAGASFTAWKLELLNCIAADPRVSGPEFRTAFVLLQHANSETRAIFPSQATIADKAGMKERAIRSHIAGLVEKGWLSARRQNRQKPNVYAFDDRHMNAVLDRLISLADDRAERRKRAARNFLRGKNVPVSKGGDLPLPTGRSLPVNTLREHERGTPELELGIELREVSNG